MGYALLALLYVAVAFISDVALDWLPRTWRQRFDNWCDDLGGNQRA